MLVILKIDILRFAGSIIDTLSSTREKSAVASPLTDSCVESLGGSTLSYALARSKV